MRSRAVGRRHDGQRHWWYYRSDAVVCGALVHRFIRRYSAAVSLSRVWLFLAIALPVLAAMLASLSTVDLTYQLRAGSEILDARAIPTTDSWTFTAFGLPWTDQQWGAQAILELMYRLGGWTGLLLLRAALVALIFGALLVIGLRRGLGARRAAWLSMAAFVVASPALALRPQLLGMACFALVLLLVTDRRDRPGRLWLVPVVVAVWANLHGSFFLGPLVLGLAWAEDVHDKVAHPHRTLLVAVVSAVAACLTPFGPMVWAYAVGLSTNPGVTGRITEWQPTTLRDATGLLFFASVAAVAVLIARLGRRTPWPTLLWLGTFAFIGAYALRGEAWWPLAAVAAIAGVLVTAPGAPSGQPARLDPPDTPLMRRLNLVVVGGVVLATVILLPIWRPVEPATGAPVGVLTDAPPGITAALRAVARPGSRIFNPQPWGSWFEFALPDTLVAIDSRIELFPPSVWDDYAKVAAGVDGWQAILQRWDADIVVIEGADPGFMARLEAAGWRQVVAGETGSIWERGST